MRAAIAATIFKKVRKRFFGRELDHIRFYVDSSYPKPNKQKGRYPGVVGQFRTRQDLIVIMGWYLKICNLKDFYATCIHELVHAKMFLRKMDHNESLFHGKAFIAEILPIYRAYFTPRELRYILSHEKWQVRRNKSVKMNRALRYHKVSI